MKQYTSSFLLGIIIVLGSIQKQFAADFIQYANTSIVNGTFSFTKSGNYTFNANDTYHYQPTLVATGSPMIKITTSDIIIDFKDIGIYNQGTSHSGWIGIEIGWTPAELAADSTRVQPKHITIKNVSLYTFDCGVLVHEGVRNVTIDKVHCFNADIGILMMGSLTLPVEGVKIRNVEIIGFENSSHASLVNLKTIIETTYGYGANSFMPLQADPFNSNSVDVYTYYGMYLNNLIDLTIENLRIEDIGYENYGTVSEGNGLRTIGVGFALKNSKRINMNDVIVSEIFSEIKAVGLQLDNCFDIEICKGLFCFQKSAKRAVGIEVTNVTSAPYSVESIKLEDVQAKSNDGGEVGIGMDLSSVRGLSGSLVRCKLNHGGQQAYGIYANTLYTVNLKDSSVSENLATGLVNNVATAQGIMAAGFYGINVNSMQLKTFDFNSMKALNTAYGLYLKNSSSVQCFDSLFVANVATMMRSGEAADIRSQQDSQEISKHAPVVSATSTGAYGVFLDTCLYTKFEGCSANSNTAHRAMGMHIVNCRAVAIRDTFASTQYATGLMLDASLVSDNSVNPTAVPIQAAHKPLLFGDSSKTSVNALATTDLFLQKMTAIRTSQIAGTAPVYSDIVGMLTTSSLLQAMVARYRLWGVAIGICLHNVTGSLIEDCTCVGNISTFDSGVGICYTGRNTDHTIDTSTMSFNVGGFAAVQTAATSPTALYAYQYNLMGLKPFWSMLTTSLTTPLPLAANGDAVGFLSDATHFTAQGSKIFGNGTTGDAIYVNLNGLNQRVMVSPIGPVGAGLVMADYSLEGLVKNCSLYGNLGNAGHTAGALFDRAFSVTLDTCNIAGNIANIYGFASGILDVTTHSPNLYMNNFLEGNKCSIFNNGNYIVPFNPADLNNLVFPVTKMMNGHFLNLTTTSDNIVMEYSQDSTFYPVEYLTSIPVPTDMRAYLTANGCWH